MSRNPVEILYADPERISSYVEQITERPSVVEQAKTIGVQLDVLGPTVSAQQSEIARSRTLIENIRILEPHLERNSLLQRHRPTTDRVRTNWVRENCTARRVVVPPLKDTRAQSAGFAFWMSEPPAGAAATAGDFRQGPLCLLERPPAAVGDDDTLSFAVASTYTLLQSLVHYTRSALQGTEMELQVPHRPHPNPYATFSDDSDHPLSLREYPNVKQHCFEFATNPVPMLESWGCFVPPPRRIQTLYRIREIGRDSSAGWEAVSVFAYPLWIVEHDHRFTTE
ncbi:MAG: hypothetical protein AAGA55_10095 [Planctomycetota bacterium]